MPGQGPTTPRCSMMVLMLLTLSRLPSEDALSLAQEHLQSFPKPSDIHSSPNVSRFQELQKRFKDLMTRLQGNQTWEDSNPDLIPAVHVQILIPKLRLGPGSQVHLYIPRANLTMGLPTVSRLHQALLRLSPTESSSWDVTRPLQRQLDFGISREPVIRLHLPAPSERLLAELPSAQLRLELHWWPRAGRGRRSPHARSQNRCPLGEGRCCRLKNLRASLHDLGWADWVISPRELDLRMCSGACPSQFRSANMHAQMLARLHSLRPEAAPAPCCVPSSYEPVVLMHRDSQGRVSLTTYDNLVAKDCHCV